MKISAQLIKQGVVLNGRQDPGMIRQNADLVIVFGARNLLEGTEVFDRLRKDYPSAHLLLCSTAGEIFGSNVFDDAIAITAIDMERTMLKAVSVNMADHDNSFEAGRHLISTLPAEELAYVLVLSDGSQVNGSELVHGMESANKGGVPITGGLAGDAARFESTLVGLDAPPQKGCIAAVGFYGKNLVVTHGSRGGWDVFGPEKKVSRSKGNKLYEIDDQNALELYQLYLGKYADQLPGSALLFPLSVILPGQEQPVVRTILSIDRTEQCMVFAGDVPEGSRVRFMKANFDKLVDAATQAALQTYQAYADTPPALAILISCVGRKIILGNRVEEEVDVISDTFGDQTFLTGFYSYGEISPLVRSKPCELHNQTMTITTLNEA